MFRTAATVPAISGPVVSDWTTHELVEWIAADDTRCHDGALAPLLTALDAALDGGRSGAAVLAPASPVVLVRAIAARLRARPDLRRARVRDLVATTALAPS